MSQRHGRTALNCTESCLGVYRCHFCHVLHVAEKKLLCGTSAICLLLVEGGCVWATASVSQDHIIRSGAS